LTIKTGGRVVSGWMIHQAEGKAPLVLYFGGNGEIASNRILYLVESGDISAFAGCNFAFLDYPGYGLSSGSPGEASLKQMGLDVYDALSAREDVDANRIVLFGFSMGTGIANYVAANRTATGLVLFAPYADGYDLYNTMVPVFYGPLRALVAFKMESVKFAESISLKPLIFSSVDDEMVPIASSERLSAAYPAECEFVRMQGFGHNGYWSSDDVLLRVSQYIAEVINLGE
jgi:pimeloyl-ACP methyl ester carboxylesterase